MASASADGHSMNFEDMDPTTGYFMEAVMGHERVGFILAKAAQAAQLRL